MLHSLKILASVVGTGIALIAYIPYLIDMFKGKNKPHLYTWISIFLVTAIVGYIQIRGGAGVGAIPMVLGILVDAVILFYCFKYGTKDIVFMDKICLGITIVGLIVYILLTSKPLLSLIIVSLAEFISFLPTVRKTRNDPYSESLPSYYLIMLKLGLILLALQKYNLLTASYSVMWIIVFAVFLLNVYFWRKKVKHPARTRSKLDEAPLI